MGTDGVALFLLAIASCIGITASKGVDLGLCSKENVVCGCGPAGLQIHVPIKRCTFFYRWKPYCKACEKYNKTALCSQFKQCLSCNEEKDGGCASCPLGRYGKHCLGVCQCQNGGVCDQTNGKCECPRPYTGNFCEKSLQGTCGAAPNLRHGTVIGNTGSSVQEGSVASYACNDGYTLVGPSQKRCEKAGTWSGGEPRCEYMCLVPASKPNLRISVEPYVTMRTSDNPQGVELIRRVRFECQSGYMLQGATELNCQPTSQWNGEVPNCVKSCGSPPNVLNGKFAGNSFLEGSKVNYYCSKGYSMTGDLSLVCTNGQWRGTVPTCSLSVSCAAPAFNGQIQPAGSSYNPGSTITLSCNSGFELEGTPRLSCQSSGQWDAPVPTCAAEITNCPELQAPGNGDVFNSVGPASVGQKVQFACSAGYTLGGSRERECLPDGSWSGTVTSCTKTVTCADPGTPENAERVVSSPSSGRRSRLPGSRSRLGRGRGRGRLSPTAKSNGGQFAINTEITFTCTPVLYDLVGSQKRSCQSNGQWSGDQPQCVAACGKSPGARSIKIIRGEVTRIGDYPWQVFLAHDFGNGEFFGVCGGSLVDENTIVTAAHCVTVPDTTTLVPISILKVYLGKYYRNNSRDDEFVQEFSITEIHVHPSYNPLLLDSDIAVLRLSRAAKLSNRVMPVCLPGIAQSGEMLRSGENVTVTGWGETELKMNSEVLLNTTLQVITNKACEERYSEEENPLTVTANMFCAGHEDARSDTCFGDSGGPAVAFQGSGLDRRWYLVGIISWGSPVDCGIPNHYSGFTRIARFLSFIESNRGSS